jgi:hypothetical protein
MEQQLVTELYGGLLLLALLVGAVANRTNFCTMGAVSDWVNMGDKSRLRAWVLAIAIAIIGMLLLQQGELLSLDATRPEYRSAHFAWGQYLVGGLLFGIGMTLGSGCGNKTLVRLGAGNLKSLLVLLLMGGTAYLITATDLGYQLTFGLLDPLSLEVGNGALQGQEIGSLLAIVSGADSAEGYRPWVAAIVVLPMLLFVFRGGGLRSDPELLAGGLLIGLAVVAVWWLTGGGFGREVLEAVSFMDNPPAGMGVQSLTFGSPSGDLWRLLLTGLDGAMVTPGLVLLFGVVAGSFLYALFSGNFRFEWFNSREDFIRHLLGGVLMGGGAMLGMGCTFGQGITGVSTLALGSFLVLVAIVLGSALTMKVEYYKIVYEEASLLAAVSSSLVDLRLLPARFRRLEAI